jgi:hypothetical protein
VDANGDTAPSGEQSQTAERSAAASGQTSASPYDSLPDMMRMVQAVGRHRTRGPGGRLESLPASVAAAPGQSAELPTAPASVDDWAHDLAQMSELQARLVEAGRWVTGPRDFFGVMGLTGLEQCHSRMIAWLLDPNNRHGLGARFLRRLLELHWSDGPTTLNLATARAQCEVSRRTVPAWTSSCGPTT